MMITKRQALLEIIALWSALASQDHKNSRHGEVVGLKHRTAKKLLGYLPYNACPACEYVVKHAVDCGSCPVVGWTGGNCNILETSEYNLWKEEWCAALRRGHAQKIVDLALKSLENLDDKDT